MSTRAESIANTALPKVWIYRPWLDLLVGCGGWSAPLLLVAAWLTPSSTHGWAVAFYLLALVFNYPHFMATIYRAYHTRTDFEKYKFVTLHVTLLMVLTGVLLHISYALLPWIFTLYICWSPWHYSGQNYGLLMMFLRRTGAEPTRAERRWIHGAFVASYLMLLASFETGGSSDPLILSLGLPSKVTLLARIVLAAAFAVFSVLAFQRMIRRSGIRALAAPLTLAATQFLWFVVPTLLELNAAYQIPQTRYSSGILAILHSAQYLWITSYYQGREARAAGQSNWRMPAYFVTLIAGGIALFIPGPWLVSRLLHFDFTTSFLIFTAVVNIHHFILDGALWKLRDSRVSSLLVDRGEKSAAAAKPHTASPRAAKTQAAPRWFAAGVFSKPAFRVSAVALLFLWGGMDQVHFALRTDDGNLAALARAARMDPYDSAVQAQIGLTAARVGKKSEEVSALQRAVAINPHNPELQGALAQALIENGNLREAYRQYAKMLALFPRDSDALVNYGLLAAQLGHPDQAMGAWGKAIVVAPDQPNAHLYLAEAYDENREPAAAIPNWRAFLRFAGAHPDDPSAGAAQRISATIRLADDEAAVNGTDPAQHEYLSAITLAERSGDAKLASLALVHLADLQDTAGDVKSAAASYQRALSLDAKSKDSRSEASDWFNYGQFLHHHGLSDELAYACVLHAEDLLAGSGGEDLRTVKDVRRQIEARLGEKAVAAQKNLPALLARATRLPASSL